MECQTTDLKCWRQAALTCSKCGGTYCFVHLHASVDGIVCGKCFLSSGVRTLIAQSSQEADFLCLARLACREAELFESKSEYAERKSEDKGHAYEDAARRYSNEAAQLRSAVARLVNILKPQEISST